MNARMFARIAASVAVAAVLALGAEAGHAATEHARPTHSTVTVLADGGSTTAPPTTPAGPASNPWE